MPIFSANIQDRIVASIQQVLDVRAKTLHLFAMKRFKNCSLDTITIIEGSSVTPRLHTNPGL